MGHAHVRGARRAAPVRPRYRRISAAGSAVGITLVAVLGGMGWLPTHHETAVAATRTGRPAHAGMALSGSSARLPTEPPAHHSAKAARVDLAQTEPAPLPPGSGSGRRVVFDMSSQQVWLVGGQDRVRRTYPVSGSVTDNLQPGSYEVYSRSRHAIGVDDSGTMDYMVRFAHGPEAAIGFHDIPVKDGALVQSRDQLGTPQSHGCIRQWRPDAKALWEFAPVGTTVVVVA